MVVCVGGGLCSWWCVLVVGCGQSYNIKLIATVSAIDSTASDVLEVEMV